MAKDTDTRYIQIKGVIEWAKVFEQNRDRTGPGGAWKDHNGGTSVDMLLDEDNVEILEASGSTKLGVQDRRYGKEGEDDVIITFVGEAPRKGQKIPKGFTEKDRIGLPRYKMTRMWDETFGHMGGPAIAHADGAPWTLDNDGLIGNGSVGIAHLEVYTTGNDLVGTRLNGLQVLEHVVFESDRTGGVQFDDHSAEYGNTKSTEPEVTSSADLDDDIPF